MKSAIKTQTGKTHTASFGLGATGGGVIRKLTDKEQRAQQSAMNWGK